MTYKICAVAAFCVALVLGGCSSIVRNHGFVPTQAEIDDIIVGVDTRSAVINSFGVPAFGGLRDENAIYYVASKWRHFGPTKPRPIERQIVAVVFDTDDTVSDIVRLGLEDGQFVVLNRRISDGGAKEISVIQQILGSLGRFDASTLFGDS